MALRNNLWVKNSANLTRQNSPGPPDGRISPRLPKLVHQPKLFCREWEAELSGFEKRDVFCVMYLII